MRKVRALLVMMLLSAAPAAAQDSQGTLPASDAPLEDMLDICFQCHGDQGVSIIPSRPSIAGQNASYVARQLQAFKNAAALGVGDSDGDADDEGDAGNVDPQGVLVRSDPVMEHMIQGLDEGMINRLAFALSQMSCGSGGEPTRALPPKPSIAGRCDICHGEDGIAAQGETPNLAGQQRAYLRRQLLLIRETAFGAEPREGDRWRAHPIMEREAARISISDVDALARYYAALDCRGNKP